MSATETISMLEGNTFVVSDPAGNIIASLTDTLGLFAWDTRYLSRWVLTVNGQIPNPLSTEALEYYATQFFLVPGTGTVYVDADLSIMRKRSIGREGFREELTLLNHSDHAVDLDVRIEAAADFADLFEVKDALQKKGEAYTRVKADHLVLGYRREAFVRETHISARVGATGDDGGATGSPGSAVLDAGALRFNAHLAPHGRWSAQIEVLIAHDPLGQPAQGLPGATDRKREELISWIQAAPRLSCTWDPLKLTYLRSIVDLAALRFETLLLPEEALPAAGLPWFMAVFGRDSVLTSFQALPFAPQLARSTLRTLALLQGTRVDDFRDEEPGKILHELRYGEMTAFEERPQSPYYGSADATPLYLILLDEYERWSGDAALVRQHEPIARAALRWIEEYGDRDGDGYVDYQRKRETGLENQCWKDSWNSILFADGTNSALPRATCEIQGYVYDAKRRMARLARQFWADPALADRLEQEATDLKARFNRDYWLEERRCFALARDGQGRMVDSITSNIGHLLWSGIVDDEKTPDVVAHLMGDALFSGWGVRTMAEGEGGYNPIGYHVGTVWPHDNAFIALGLARAGYREEATRIAAGILDAAVCFRGRLPEAFAGYARTLTEYPVEYPTACSPQAWATGAPLLLLRVLLGLEPVGDHLLVNPALPGDVESLALLDIPGRWGQADAFARGRLPGVRIDTLAHLGANVLQDEQPSPAEATASSAAKIAG
jgi:glycogen debranching enzyme